MKLFCLKRISYNINTMKKNLFLFFFVFIMIHPFSLHGSQEKVFRIGIVPWIAWNLLYVAEELGFWKEEGVSVEIVNYGNIREKINSFKNGLTEISFGEPADFLPLLEKGMKIKILMCVDGSFGADKFFIKKDIEIRNLKAKKIALSPYPAGDFFVWRGLKALQILDTIDFVNVDSPSMGAEAFLSGKVDGVYLYPPSSFKVEMAGNAVELFNSAKFPIFEVIFCREDLIEREKDSIKKILIGWIKASIWSARKENAEKFLEIAKKRMYFRKDEFDTQKWKKTMKEVKIFSKPAEILRVNKKNGDFWRYFMEEIDFLVEKGYIKKKVNPEDVIEMEIWNFAYKKVFP